MKRYFKCDDAESGLGIGTAYFEVTEDGWVTRQIEIYGETWMWADEAHPQNYVTGVYETFAGRTTEVVMGLGEKRLEPGELRDDEAISAEEFETAWQEALKRRPEPGRPVPRAQDINR